MAVSYKRLWKLLIDKDMKKKDLCDAAGISMSTVTKLGNNCSVRSEALEKICLALNCTMDEIMEVFPNGSREQDNSRTLRELTRII